MHTLKRVSIAATCVVLVALSACGRNQTGHGPSAQGETTPTQGSAQPAGGPNSLFGTVTTEDGRPVSGASIHVLGTSYEKGAVEGDFETKADGTYVANTGPGSFAATYGSVTRNFEGQSFRFRLFPADGSGYAEQKDVAAGVRRDFVWKLSGLSPSSGIANNAASYYGSYAAVHVNDPARSESTEILGVGDVIRLTLTPTGPDPDGSSGKTLVMEVNVDRATNSGLTSPVGEIMDIPIVPMNVTAEIVMAGTAIKARVAASVGTEYVSAVLADNAALPWRPGTTSHSGESAAEPFDIYVHR